LREISKADQIRDDYVNDNKIGVASIRRLLEKIYVRWCRGKASTKRQSYIEKIEAFRLQGEATHEVSLDVPLVEPSGAADDVSSTSV
jgi:hypothetical protein